MKVDLFSDCGWIVLATRYRYSLPVLAELMRGDGCKFITLVRRLECSDRAIRQSLDYLIQIGWVTRNPGYGHPSRPEYVLTESAPDALPIWSELQKWDQDVVAFERWPLIILPLLDSGARFGMLLRSTNGITPRALSIALAKLIDSGLATREIMPGNPPATEYRATPWGEKVVSLIRDQPHGAGGSLLSDPDQS
jgi:DNA-binding HxlR family transcriptional regulator